MPRAAKPLTDDCLLDTWGRRNNRKFPDKSCKVCGTMFKPRRESQLFCSKPCMYQGRRTPAACIPGPDNPNYKGGWLDYKGYRQVKQDGKNVRQHRLIMEQHLDRTLSPDQVVHHINGEKTDNRIENLEIVEFGKHSSNHNRSRIYKKGYKMKLSDAERVARSNRAKKLQFWRYGSAVLAKAKGGDPE